MVPNIDGTLSQKLDNPFFLTYGGLEDCRSVALTVIKYGTEGMYCP